MLTCIKLMACLTMPWPMSASRS